VDKKIYVISVNLRETCIVAGFRNGILLVQKLAQIKTADLNSLAKIKREMSVYQKNGFTVAINEPITRLATGFTPCRLADTDENNQPRLIAALTAYQQLLSRKSIRFSEGTRKITVPENVYEKEISDKGITTYRIDWESISEEAIALLTVIYSAVYNSSIDGNYLKSVFGIINKRKSHRKMPRFL